MKRIVSAVILLVIIFSLSACKHVPTPQITNAEFPFEIVYEVDGEVITLKDSFVCEFDGFGWNEAQGRHRQWKGYVKSSGKDYVLLLQDGNLQFAVKVGSAAYYMGDPTMDDVEAFTPSIYYIRTFESGGVSSGVAGIESLLEEYKIKLISWTLSKPINNIYR